MMSLAIRRDSTDREHDLERFACAQGVFRRCGVASHSPYAAKKTATPAGTPAGRPVSMSLHGTLHIVAAGIAFLCLIAACFVLARRFARLRQRRWAAASRATGALFLVGFGGVASGSSSPVVVLGFWVALLVVWGWLAALSLHLYRTVAEDSGPTLG